MLWEGWWLIEVVWRDPACLLAFFALLILFSFPLRRATMTLVV